MSKFWWLAIGMAAATAFAQESPFQFNGFVDTYHAVQTKHPHDFTTSRTRLRAELRVDYENAYLFTRLFNWSWFNRCFNWSWSNFFTRNYICWFLTTSY